MKHYHKQNSKSEFTSVLSLILGFFRWDFLSERKSHLKGDTLVEVMFAVAIFGLASVGAISIMNRGLYDAQRALEVSMARQEIDAQAEALRFIHEAYQSEQNSHEITTKIYEKIWQGLQNLAYKPSDPKLAHFFDSYNGVACSDIYSSTNAFPESSLTTSAAPFIVNTRRVDNNIAKNFMDIHGSGGSGWYYSATQQNGNGIIIYQGYGGKMFEETPTYPRLLFTSNYSATNNVHDVESGLSDRDIDDATGRDISSYYNTLTKAQGLWIVAIASDDTTNPEFYDFYIRTCWNSPGNNNSNTISTTIRLFNPNYHT